MASIQPEADIAYITSAEALSVRERMHSPKRYVYEVSVDWSNSNSTTCYRGYTDFCDFQRELLSAFPFEARAVKGVPRAIPYLPGRKIFKRSTAALAEKRLPKVNDYVQRLVAMPENVSRCELVLKFFRSNWQEDRLRGGSFAVPRHGLAVIATEDGPSDRPCHKNCESLFSSRSGFHNYRGLLNDCILLLVLSNSHNVVSNLYKYGILVNPKQWLEYTFNEDTMPSWTLLLLSYMFATLMLVGERMASKGQLSNRMTISWYVVVLGSLLVFPVMVIFTLQMGPLGSLVVLSWYTILWLKLVSYCQVNWWCRTASSPPETSEKDKKLVLYPNNLTFSDLIYFCWAPTLCYELNFPRNPRIRKIFLVRRILEAVFLFHVVLAIFQQWLMPTALNSLQPFKDMDYTKMLERLLLLAIPNHIFWLLFFYFFFHSCMNLVGELLRFADREFYGDWWNSDSIQQFWKMWNIPVHRWAVRHIYHPLKREGVHKGLATLVVFFLSAFFHEVSSSNTPYS